MRAGILAGRALVSSLHRIAHKPQLLNTPFSSSSLFPKSSSSIAPVLRKEYHGMEFGLSSSSSLWSQSSTAPFVMSHIAMDGHRRSPFGFSASVLEGASTGCFRPTAQNPKLLQLEFWTSRSFCVPEVAHYRLYHALQGTEPHRDTEIAYSSVYDMNHLRAAYEKLHRTVAPGIDGRAQTELTERGFQRLSEELRRHIYAPKPAQRVILPTPDGGRPLSIASTIDKVVQTAVVMVLEPAFEPTFRNSSHGFRIGRSCHSCLKVLRSTWLGITWLIPIDLQKIFTKAHHEILLELMAPVLHSKSMEDLIRKLLNAGYVDIYNLTDRTQYNTELVMGSIISPLCNNILLHELDCYVEDELIPMFGAGALSPSGGEGPKRLKYLRYADNILLGLKGSKQDGIAIRQAVQTFLQQKLKFDINEQTSPVLNARSEMTKFLGALVQYG